MLRQGQVAVKFNSDGAGRVIADLLAVGKAGEDVGAQLGTATTAADNAGGAFGRLGGIARSALAGIGVTAVVTFATQSVVQFQKVEAQLGVLLGSFDAARDKIGQLRQLSTEIGGSTNELAEAYAGLIQRGLDPTRERLQSIINIATQTGKQIPEIVNAYAAAARGQAEAITKVGASFTRTNDGFVVEFKDGTRQLIEEGESFLSVLDRIGTVEFAGAAVADANTLSGAFTGLTKSASDLAQSLLVDTGLVGALTQILNLLNQGANDVTRFSNIVDARIRQIRELAPARDDGSFFGAQAAAIQSNLAPFLALKEAVFQEVPQDILEQFQFAEVKKGLEEQGAATDALTKQTQELVAKLLDEAEAVGKSSVQILELAKAKAVSKAATEADRAALVKAFDARIAAEKAVVAQEKAERASAKATLEKAKAEREAEKAEKERAQALERVTAQTRALIATLDPGQAILDRYVENVQTLVEALKAGVIPAEEFEKRLKELTRNRNADLAIEQITGTPQQVKSLAQQQAEAYAQEWEDAITSIGNLLEDVLVDRFGQAGSVVAGILREVAGLQTRGESLASNVQRGSQALGRGFETAPDFVGPPTAQGNANASAGELNIGTAIGQVAVALGPEIGSQIGGNGRNAQLGAQIGQVVGSIFGPIGSLVGSILGGLLGGAFDGTPRITVSGNPAGQERRGRSAFGTFGASTRDVDIPVAQVIEAVQRVDNAIASFLTGSERNAASAALRSFSARSSGNDLTIEEVLRQRVATVIQTVEPAFASFLNAIDDVEERIRQFEGLRVLKEQIEDFDRIVAEALGDPLEAQTARFARLTEDVEKAGDQLAAAIDAQDLAQAAQASQDYQRAILELAQAQIDAATQLEQALIDIDRSSRAFDLNLLQRLANLPGGDPGTVVGQLNTNIGITRGNVLGARTPEQALAALNEFIATVDAWLQQATAQVRANLQTQLAALDTERDGILAAAQLRADIANAQAQAAAERDRAALDALNEQLRLAQQWVGVLDRANGLIDELRFGSANPIGLQSQFANLGSEADSLFAQFNAGTGNRTEIATRLLDILTQQQQVGASLFDRPSDESVALYNQILARINAVRDVAQPEADRARLLQEQIASLQQQTVNAVNTLTDATYFLTAEERERLDEIEEERRTAEEEAQEALDEINEQAREYYTWARTTGLDLQRQQRELLQQQLDTLTGGMAVQDFIALKQSEARDALYAIRDDLRTFLDSIRVVGAVVGPGGPGRPGPGGPGGGGETGSAAPGVTVSTGDIVVTVGSGDPAQVATAVRQALRDELPVLATALRRELQTA